MTPDPGDICLLPATRLIDAFRGRELSPVEVTEAVLARIDRFNPTLNAFVTVTPDLALEQARRAEEEYGKGTAKPLSGVPISIKDLTWTAGIRTTMGSRLFADFVPGEDAPFVERVKAAEAVILGKTATPEFGWKGESTSPLNGSARNPWALDRTPGGSSGGGAAAVAAGLGPMAQGSDGAGSIRIPCSFSGIFGMKPSFGLLPMYPASRVPDLSHMGPMTRTVADAALLMNASAGADSRDRASWSSGVDYLAAIEHFDLAGLKIAWSPDLGYAPVEPAVRSATAVAVRTFEELGCHVEECHPSLDDPWPAVEVIWATGMAAMHINDLDRVREKIDQGRLEVVERGFNVSGVELVAAFMARNAHYHGWRSFMERFDLVITPTLPCTAFPVGLDQPGSVDGQLTTYLGWTTFTYPFNLTGQPAATVPCGFDADGLPIGLQIVGRWRDDATVLRAAAAFEQIAPWSARRPAGFE